MNKDMREIFGIKLRSRSKYLDPGRVGTRQDLETEIETTALKWKSFDRKFYYDPLFAGNAINFETSTLSVILVVASVKIKETRNSMMRK